MSSVNLDTYSLSLLAAKEDILNSKCSTNWAVFTYEKRNDLKLSDSGAGGLEELAGKFTDNSLLYALCQVKDANTGQPRIILINWAGEKVDEVYRQTCAAHLPAIKAFFKEASVVLTARHADEVTSDAIHNVLASLSLAGSTSRKPRAMDSEELVGTNYRKTNPALEMRRTNRDSFWAQAEREEEERKEEERRRLQEERKRWDRERMEQEKKEAEERDRRIKEKEHLIEEQRKEHARIQAEERKTEKSKWEQQQKEHEEEMRDRFRRSESIEKAAEAAVLVSQRSLNPRDFFRQREHSFSSSHSPTSPPAGGTRRPALRYQRSLTESAFIFQKSESSTSTPPSPSPSYARRNEFFSSTSPRSPPETCSPSLIFSKAGAPTRPGRFPMASPPRAGSHPHKIFSRADSLPAANLTHYGSLRPTSPPNIRRGSPTSLARPEPLSPASLPRSENPAPASPPREEPIPCPSPPKVEPTPPASLPRSENPAPASPPREEPIPCPSPPKVEPTPPASLPKDESSLSLPRYESPLPDSPPTVECLPLTSSLGAESPQSSSPPRAASPPTVSSPIVEPALSSSSDRANSPFSAISTRYETVPEESTPRVEQALPASPPRAVSPSLVTISNETSVSLESTPNEDSVLRETMHHVESVVVESQHVTESLPIENQPKYDSAPEETSLRLETQSPGLPTMSVDVLEASAAHVAFTEEAEQGELKDPPSFNSDISSISAMLHSLPHYTPLETEWGASNSLQLEDISAAPSYRHGDDSEPDEPAPLGSQGPDVPHTSQESQVNGARHNGIGGQEDEEGLQEEMPEEEEAEPGSTPKACVRAVYEYHAEDGTRLSLEHNDLMPVPESQNEA